MEAATLALDLALLCRTHIFGELWALACLRRRGGESAASIMRYLARRAPLVQQAVYERKWLVGLRQLVRSDDPADITRMDSIWRVVVQDTTAEDVSKRLTLLLDASEQNDGFRTGRVRPRSRF
jgi:hypothetical protein